VLILTDKESKKDPSEIRESLDNLVHNLEQDSSASTSWGASVASNKERWEHIKSQIHERQKALKQLVTDKKAGIIGIDEFEEKYRKLQDELVELETAVYNLRLGTDVR
jgi:chromosome segregation ATPase